MDAYEAIMDQAPHKFDQQLVLAHALNWSGPLGAALLTKLAAQTYVAFLETLTVDDLHLLSRILSDYFRAGAAEHHPLYLSALRRIAKDVYQPGTLQVI
jgi:hypothetical protein